ncbi:hypothetical protein TKK_0000145 [Trichogramma kaykai]
MDIYEEMAIDSMDADEIVENPMVGLSSELLQSVIRRPRIDGKFFEVVPQKSTLKSVFTKCIKCAETVRGSAEISSNFKKHLKNKHNKEDLDEYDKYLKSAKKRQNLSNDDTNVDIIKTTKRVTCSFDAGTFNNNIVRFILDNMVAFRAVKSPLFRAIFDDINIKIGNGTIKHLSRAKVVTVTNALIFSQKTEIKNQMKTVEHVCLTADVLSSPTRSFMGVTAHWVSIKINQMISTIITSLFDEYDLNNHKVVRTFTGNGSNFVKTFRVFGNRDDISFDNEDEIEPIDLENALQDGISFMTDDYYSSDDKAESANRLDEEFNIESSTLPDDVITLSRHFRCTSHTLNLIATTDTAKFMKLNEKFETVHPNVVGKCEKGMEKP